MISFLSRQVGKVSSKKSSTSPGPAEHGPLSPIDRTLSPARSEAMEAGDSGDGESARPARHPVEPLSGAKTVLIVGVEPLSRRFLSGAIRQQVRCRVLEASGPSEGRYLAAVEEKIHLLLLDSASTSDELKFAQWFRWICPDGKILVVSDSLWELNWENGEFEHVLVAKPFSQSELILGVRRILQ